MTTTADRTWWRIPAALILLAAVPVVAGTARLAELSLGADITPDNARHLAAPVPIVVHIVTATVFSVVGAFQFSPTLRRRRHRWHRAAGRVLIPTGLLAALSGLWLTAFSELPPSNGALLGAFRYLFGSMMVAALVLAVLALRRRDFAAHGAWVTRGYAIGLGAGTQAFVLGPWLIAVGEPGPTATALLMAAGWVINLVVAEWVIARRAARRRPRPRPVARTARI